MDRKKLWMTVTLLGGSACVLFMGCAGITAPAIPTLGSTPTPTPAATVGCTPPEIGGPGYGSPQAYDDLTPVPAGNNPGCSSGVTYFVAGGQVDVHGNLTATANGAPGYAGADWHYYNFYFATYNYRACALLFGCFGANGYDLIVDPCGVGPATFSGPTTLSYASFSPFSVEVAVVGASGTPGPYSVSVWEAGTPTATPFPTDSPTPTPTP